MKKVLSMLALVTMLAIIAAFALFSHVPKSAPSSVIGEKSAGGVAVVLPERVSMTQAKMLATAYDIAKADGHKEPELVQAVLLQETQAGANPSYKVANASGTPYFGLMQVQLAAARDVLAKWPQLFATYGFHTRTDDEVKANLILNERFNIEVGSKYLLVLQRDYGYRGEALLTAYNKGPGAAVGMTSSPYSTGAMAKLNQRRARKV